jgi:hypothetical protein
VGGLGGGGFDSPDRRAWSSPAQFSLKRFSFSQFRAAGSSLEQLGAVKSSWEQLGAV